MNYSKDRIISSMNLFDRIGTLPIVGPVIKHRFIKFGMVGLSGTVVNLFVLYVNQEILFKNIYPIEKRLHLSLSGAIFLATLHNYLWNRAWTWSDRKRKTRFGILTQMSQYFLACGLAIFFQYLFTTIFARIIHYLLANIMAIILAAIFAYVLNDVWTFSVRRKYSCGLKDPGTLRNLR